MAPLKMQPAAIREYIPVELVRMPSQPRAAARPPSAIPPASAAHPRETSASSETSERPDPEARTAVPLPQLHDEAPSADVSPHPQSAVATGNGTTGGTSHSRTTGNVARSAQSGTGASQPQSPNKGSYQAFYKLTRLPSFRSRSEPVYPDTERMTGGEARVLAEIYINEHGIVDDVAIKKSGGKLFDKAVIDAVRKSSFHPGYMREKAVATVIQIPYLFKLK